MEYIVALGQFLDRDNITGNFPSLFAAVESTIENFLDLFLDGVGVPRQGKNIPERFCDNSHQDKFVFKTI